MSKFAHSYAQLDLMLAKMVDKILEDSVMPWAVRMAQKNVEDYVYKAYGSNLSENGQPVVYVRRGDSDGGLMDESSFVRNISDLMTLDIRNIAQPRPMGHKQRKVTNLAMLVDKGDGNGGHYSYDLGKDTFGDFKSPRPFMRLTQEQVDDDDIPVDMIKEGLRQRGLTVK